MSSKRPLTAAIVVAVLWAMQQSAGARPVPTSWPDAVINKALDRVPDEEFKFGKAAPAEDVFRYFEYLAGCWVDVDWSQMRKSNSRVGVGSFCGSVLEEKAPIGPDSKFTFHIRDVSTRVALRELLNTLAGKADALDYAVSGGAIHVSAASQIDRQLVSTAYDVSNFPTVGRFTRAGLVDLVRSLVRPGSWSAPGRGVELKGDRLIVSHSPPAQREVAALLAMLESRKNPPRGQQFLDVMGDIEPQVRFNYIGFENCLLFLRDLKRINMTVHEMAMEQAGTPPEAEVTIQLRDVPFQAALDETLLAAAGKPGVLDWAVRDNVLIVSSTEEFQADMFVRVYELSWIEDLPGAADPAEALVKLIATVVAPDTWTRTGGRIERAGRVLLVRQSGPGHRQIDALLHELGTPPDYAAGNRRTNKNLDRINPEIRFHQIALGNGLLFIRDLERLNMLVDWPALEGKKIDRNTEITLYLQDTKANVVLSHILDEAGGKPGVLDWLVWGGIVYVSTVEGLDAAPVLRVYDVRELVGKDSAKAAELIKDLQAKVAPKSWGPKGPGRMVEFHGRLVVRIGRRSQQQLAEQLGAMRN